jgi:hypothetical protein
MKKIFIFWVLILGGLISNAQGPIQPYKESEYSISEVNNFALGSTSLSACWRRELVRIVNDGLKASGEALVLTESNTSWILLDHTRYERRNLVSFRNSKRVGNGIEFFDDSNFDGMVAVFSYGKCTLVIYKTKCINLTENVVCASVPVQTDPIISSNTITVIHDTIHDSIYLEQPSSNPNERIVTAGKRRTVDYGAKKYPDNNYCYTGNQWYQSCNCGYNFVLGFNFSWGYSYCPNCNHQFCQTDYHCGPYYVDNHRWIDYGARNYQSNNNSGSANTGTPRPNTVNVPFGDGGNNTGDDDDNDSDDDNGNGSGTSGWDRSAQHPNPSVSQNQTPVSVQKPVVNSRPAVSNQSSGYSKPQNNYQPKPKPVTNTNYQRPTNQNYQQKPVNTQVQRPTNSNYQRPANTQNYSRPTNSNMSRSTSSNASRTVSASRTVQMSGRR